MKAPISIQPSLERQFYNATPSDDKLLLSYAAKVEGRKVIASDAVLACLMCMMKSVYSWDLQITKNGDTLTIDKRAGGVTGMNNV